MKGNKARGLDGIVIEMIKALDDFGIDKLTIMANEIYDTGKIPQDLSKSILIALPKKPCTIECELHRTISLIINEPHHKTHSSSNNDENSTLHKTRSQPRAMWVCGRHWHEKRDIHC